MTRRNFWDLLQPQMHDSPDESRSTQAAQSYMGTELSERMCALVIGALADATSLDSHFLPAAKVARDKLQRIRQSLGAVIDVLSQIKEDSRPAVLHTVGFLAAVDKLAQARCTEAGVVCTLELPPGELRLRPSVGISLYRFVDEALVLACKSASSLKLHVASGAAGVVITLSHDGRPFIGRRGELSAWLSMTNNIHMAGGMLEAPLRGFGETGPAETVRATVPMEPDC